MKIGSGAGGVINNGFKGIRGQRKEHGIIREETTTKKIKDKDRLTVDTGEPGDGDLPRPLTKR